MRRRRASITAFLLLTGLMGVTSLWLRAQLRQYALNRQLIAALMKHDIRLALALVNAGADPNTPCNPPPAPTFKLLWNQLLHRSNVPGKLGTTALLLACGAEWNDDNRSAIKANGQIPDAPPLVRAMLRHGADVNAPDARGWTPLLWAVYNGRGGTAAVLLEHGADANAKNGYGYTPLMYALSYPDIVRLLVTHGADVNARIPLGSTHLTLAVQYEADPEVVRLLLEHGARVDAQDMGGCTALYLAVLSASSRQDSVVEDDIRQLLAHGADPNLSTQGGMTAFKIARRARRPDLIALLKQGEARKQP